MMNCKRVGHLKHASMIKSFPGMQHVEVNKNAPLHIMDRGTNDICDKDVRGCIPVDSIGHVLCYEHKHWLKWVQRIKDKLENGCLLRAVLDGHPKVR